MVNQSIRGGTYSQIRTRQNGSEMYATDDAGRDSRAVVIDLLSPPLGV